MKSFKLIIFFLFIGINSGFSQRMLRYKDVDEVLNTKSTEEAFMVLKEFQYYNAQNAVAYYQLGKITQLYSKKFDPMIYPFLVEYFTRETDNYLKLSKFYLEKKGKITNKESTYFSGVSIIDGSKRVGLVDVIYDIDKRLELNAKYQKNVKLISGYFEKSAYYYDHCIQNFRELLVTQPKLKDLYLNANDSLLNRLDLLKSDFDSTLYYLTEYQNALVNYPIKNYKPEYVLKKIETYRLEGLTTVSFLYNMFYIWDFGSWVKDFNSVLKSEIIPLRKKMITADERLNKAVEYTIETNENTDSMEVYTPAEALLNEISKYDYESPIVALYDYKIAKINFLKAGKSSLLRTDLYRNPSEIVEIAKHFKTVSDLEIKMDKKLKAFSITSKSASLNKYMDFVEKQYKSKENYRNLKKQNKIEDNKMMQTFLQNYYSIIEESKNRNFYNSKYVSFKEDSIALYNNKIDSLAKFTSTQFLDWGKNTLIGGYIHSESLKNKVGFVAETNDSTTIWTRSIKPKDNVDLETTKLLLGENSVYATAQTANKLFVLEYNAVGESTPLFDKKFDKKVSFLNYDDIAEQFFICGESFSKENIDSISLITWGKLGEDLWENSIDVAFKGKVVSILSYGDRFFIVLNTKGIFAVSNNQFLFQEKPNWQVSILSVSKEGKVLKVKNLDFQTNITALEAIKLNSREFSIVGQYGEKLKVGNKPFNIFIDNDLFLLKMY